MQIRPLNILFFLSLCLMSSKLSAGSLPGKEARIHNSETEESSARTSRLSSVQSTSGREVVSQTQELNSDPVNIYWNLMTAPLWSKIFDEAGRPEQIVSALSPVSRRLHELVWDYYIQKHDWLKVHASWILNSFNQPHHKNVRKLRLKGSSLTVQHLQALVAFENVSSLSLRGYKFKMLQEYTPLLNNLKRLRALSLANTDIGKKGVRLIAKNLTFLTALNMDNNALNDDSVSILATALTQLEYLSLKGNKIKLQGAISLVSAQTALKTLHLHVSAKKEKSEQERTFFVSFIKHLTHLKALHLDYQFNPSSEQGLDFLRKISQLESLELPSLAHCNSSPDELLQKVTPYWTQLRALQLGFVLSYQGMLHDITLQGAQTIAQLLGTLHTLDLRHQTIGDEGVNALALNLPQLRILDLRNNLGMIRVGQANLLTDRLYKQSDFFEYNYHDNKALHNQSAIVIAHHLWQLRALGLPGSALKEEGLIAIAQNLGNLEILALNNDPLDKGMPTHLIPRYGETPLTNQALTVLSNNLHRLDLLALDKNQLKKLSPAILSILTSASYIKFKLSVDYGSLLLAKEDEFKGIE